MLQKLKDNKGMIGFLLFNLAFFMMDTTQSYFSIYLKSIGLTTSKIGIISGTAALVALVAQPVIGALCDRASSKNRVLQALILGTAILYPLVLLNTNFIYILLIYILYYCVRRVQPSLNTSMSVEFAETTGHNYGPIRMMGAVGYAIAGLIVARIAGLEDGTRLTFVTYSAFCVLNILLIFLLPTIKGHNSKREGNHLPVRTILKNRPILLLIFYMMFQSMAHGLFGSYYGIYFTSTLGGSNTLYGTMLSVAAAVEIPFLFLSDRLVKRFGTKNMLFVLGLMTGIRWLLTYLITDPNILFYVQCLNFVNMVNSVCISITLSKMVKPQFKTTVQTLLVTFESVVSILISSYLGGFLADVFGIRPLFLIATIISIGATIVFCGFLFKEEDFNRQADLAAEPMAKSVQ